MEENIEFQNEKENNINNKNELIQDNSENEEVERQWRTYTFSNGKSICFTLWLYI